MPAFPATGTESAGLPVAHGPFAGEGLPTLQNRHYALGGDFPKKSEPVHDYFRQVY
ncbi:hypothetical protein AGR7A_pAt20129 [Agrobacterium deltaense NCPPB 1641]|uniref:Uncharacterized protein n=1 Tax=Agrobacterium deltaense NCPPB 1641 TaxID=1183425 RepID=A0A1S7U8E8_9HYPH|nr:hypothetical protein AGR7A_pAt20129 [Agrobacterium deltaense NCPPB 1641]